MLEGRVGGIGGDICFNRKWVTLIVLVFLWVMFFSQKFGEYMTIEKWLKWRLYSPKRIQYACDKLETDIFILLMSLCDIFMAYQ